MKKIISFCLFFSILLFNCCKEKENSNIVDDENKNGIEIDTLKLQHQLLNIVRSYIQKYPKSKQYIIASSVPVYRIKTDAYECLYIIGRSSQWDFAGEFSLSSPIFPMMFFKVDDKIIYISSSIDYIFYEDKRMETYCVNAELDSKKDYWLLGVTKYGTFHVISKDAHKYMMPAEMVPSTIKFTAPLNKKE